MRESLHPGDVDACGLRDLLDGCARANPGLNLLGRQHVWNLSIGSGLAGTGFVATHGGTQPVVCAQDELLVRVVAFTDDAFAINVESDDREFPHADLLRAPVAPGRRARLAGHPTALSARYLADTPELPRSEPFHHPVDAFRQRRHIVGFDGGEHGDPQLVAAELAVRLGVDDAVSPQRLR